ncbi:MAG: type IV toxin-antitoxin system AbiEi family antitoxin domain-containing protein [Gammaproteobacteria bacterium]
MATRASLALLHQVAPEGLIVTRKQLLVTGLTGAALDRYVKSGWLHLVGRGAYLRGPDQALARPMRWQQLVISLQRAGLPLHVGGPSALALHGWTPGDERTVELFGRAKSPAWMARAKLREPVRVHRFALLPPRVRAGIVPVQWGPWDWSMWIATPERALLESVALLPDALAFDAVDALFAAAHTLDVPALTQLLGWSRHVQVNRLFLWFADRHAHPWNDQIDRTRVFVGSGKRQVVVGGRLDARYQITVPADLLSPA